MLGHRGGTSGTVQHLTINKKKKAQYGNVQKEMTGVRREKKGKWIARGQVIRQANWQWGKGKRVRERGRDRKPTVSVHCAKKRKDGVQEGGKEAHLPRQTWGTCESKKKKNNKGFNRHCGERTAVGDNAKEKKETASSQERKRQLSKKGGGSALAPREIERAHSAPKGDHSQSVCLERKKKRGGRRGGKKKKEKTNKERKKGER